MNESRRRRRIGLTTLGVGLPILALSAAYASYAAYLVALRLEPLGWWSATTSTQALQFVARCELFSSECRKTFQSLFLPSLGVTPYVLLFSAMLCVAGIIVLAIRNDRPYSARFARLGELSRLISRSSDHYAIPLLRLKRRTLGVVFDSPEEGLKASISKFLGVRPRKLTHILVSAPTQNGKSVLAKSVLANFRGSVILVDIKGELFADTSGFRSYIGDTYVLHPEGHGHRYDPISDIGSNPDALRSAAVQLIKDPFDNDPIFADRAVPLMIAALRAARLKKEHAMPFLHRLVTQGQREFIETLAELDDPLIQENLVTYLGMKPSEVTDDMYTDSRGFIASSWGTLITRLDPFFAPGVLKMFSGHDFSGANVTAKPTNLYLVWPEALTGSSAKPLALVLSSLIASMCEKADKVGSADVPTLLLLDEATSYSVPSLPKYITTMLGRGIAAMMFVQSVGQLNDRYQGKARTIVENCRARLYFGPDGDTAKEVSEALGFSSIKSRSHQKGHNRTTEQYVKRELMTPDEVSRLGDDEAILFFRGLRPVLGKRIEWFKDPVLKKRLKRPPLPIAGISTVKNS